ncbi:hypothetical protein Cgig2_026131 [Carnegiea gigantea]|uniref:Replication factor A C-terminal domain-containing protein n=1 Tax=Carnegiea gigantea TaxID=171969 RepID=A0A9Q1GQJ8_9CARY|nr:hypothetical protein Cgig2_026131 [Carnegiea gigantea]
MEEEKPQRLMCTIVAVDATSDFSYIVCSVCEKPLPSTNALCKFCRRNAVRPGSFGSKRLFRLLMSIASDSKVSRVICFDRAAKVLFGCSAEEFVDFAKLHPFSRLNPFLLPYFFGYGFGLSRLAANAGRILEGEMFQMTLSKPKNGNAEHLRVVSIVPLRSGYRPVIESLKELYEVHVAL